MNKIEYEELIAFHPGYYVKDYIEERGITQEELAKRLQTSPKYVSELVNGKINLTEEMVLRLATVFGTSTNLWLKLNNNFIEKKLEIEKRKRMDIECEFVKLIDYKYWVNLGLVKATNKAAEKVEELQKFFKVSSLSVLSERNFLVQYRTGISNVKDINVVNANAWVQTAINIGSSIDVEDFNKTKLLKIMPEIRSMTVQDPKEFYPRLNKLLASCGVALVLLPNLKNCGVNGAVKWIGKDKVILAMNDRRKYADIFWFAFFHEMGHVLQQKKKVLLVNKTKNDNCDIDEIMQNLEVEADKFSQDTLIPREEYNNFIKRSNGTFSEELIKRFSEEINILPGIIVGRLQHDGYLTNNTILNNLKTKYEIS